MDILLEYFEEHFEIEPYLMYLSERNKENSKDNESNNDLEK